MLVGETGQLQLDLTDPVRRQHAGAAPIGHHRQPAPHRAVTRGQAFGGREEGHKRAHPHRASAAQGSVKHIVAPHDGAGVGKRGPVARGFAPGLEYHHRLDIGCSPQRAHEAARVGDALHVHHDAVGVRVGGQKVQHLGQVHRCIGAERNHGGETDTVLLRPIQNG